MEALRRASVEAHELGGATVPRLPGPPEALAFFREHVAPNRPCVVARGVADGWPCCWRWDADYLAARLGERRVSVNWTPDGRGDAVLRRAPGEEPPAVFVQPHEEKATMREFMEHLRGAGRPGVPYLSAQNSSLLGECPELLDDVPCGGAGPPFAREAFGADADALNIWIGDARSVTTLHRDPFENIYTVLSGAKTFTLFPPVDSHRLRWVELPAARWVTDGDGSFAVEVDKPERTVRWSDLDFTVDPTDGLPPPLRVRVGAGETLYLPALWHHAVEQDGDPCIALNWWYDMNFDTKWVLTRLVDDVAAEDGVR